MSITNRGQKKSPPIKFKRRVLREGRITCVKHINVASIPIQDGIDLIERNGKPDGIRSNRSTQSFLLNHERLTFQLSAYLTLDQLHQLDKNSMLTYKADEDTYTLFIRRKGILIFQIGEFFKKRNQDKKSMTRGSCRFIDQLTELLKTRKGTDSQRSPAPTRIDDALSHSLLSAINPLDQTNENSQVMLLCYCNFLAGSLGWAQVKAS